MKFLLVVAVVAVIVLVVLKKKPKEGNKHSRKRVSQAAVSKDQTNFRATKIFTGHNACQAAQDLQDKLFLDGELNTPHLPLPECSQASDCHCKYERQGDRRNDKNNRRLHSLHTELYSTAKGADRRHQTRGRRTTD